MTYKTIFVDIKDEIAVLTLNRPEVMNAWNLTMAAELDHALPSLERDDGVRAIVVTGAGNAFCAGSDLSTGTTSFSEAKDENLDAGKASLFSSFMPWQIGKPVLAAINGHAIGVGITYALGCDIRIVAQDAKIQFAFVRRGIIPELGSHVIAARVAGLSRAADLLLTGRMIRGRELAEMGLASKALPAEEVLPATVQLAREFLKAAPLSVAVSKRLLWEGLTSSVNDMFKREMAIFEWICHQPDAAEGIASFLEKRDPEWSMSADSDVPGLLDGGRGDWGENLLVKK